MMVGQSKVGEFLSGCRQHLSLLKLFQQGKLYFVFLAPFAFCKNCCPFEIPLASLDIMLSQRQRYIANLCLLLPNLWKGRLHYIRSVGRLVGRPVGWCPLDSIRNSCDVFSIDVFPNLDNLDVDGGLLTIQAMPTTTKDLVNSCCLVLGSKFCNSSCIPIIFCPQRYCNKKRQNLKPEEVYISW